MNAAELKEFNQVMEEIHAEMDTQVYNEGFLQGYNAGRVDGITSTLFVVTVLLLVGLAVYNTF